MRLSRTKKDLAKTSRKKEEYVSLLKKLDIEQDREKCMKLIITLQQTEIELLKNIHRERKERLKKVIAVPLILIVALLLFCFIVKVYDTENNIQRIKVNQWMYEQDQLKNNNT